MSGFLSRVFITYVQAFNHRHKRHGTLFAGRFKHRWIDKEDYLVHLCRYIHLNPVKAHLVRKPEDWEFSNYLEWIGQRKGILVDMDIVRQYFTTPAEYINFVADEIDYIKTQKRVSRYIIES